MQKNIIWSETHDTKNSSKTNGKKSQDGRCLRIHKSASASQTSQGNKAHKGQERRSKGILKKKVINMHKCLKDNCTFTDEKIGTIRQHIDKEHPQFLITEFRKTAQVGQYVKDIGRLMR